MVVLRVKGEGGTQTHQALTKLKRASFTGCDAGDGMNVMPMECIAGLTKKKLRLLPISSSMVSHCVSCSGMPCTHAT